MDLQDLNQILMKHLAHLLLSISDQKDLVLDPELTKPLDRVAGIAFLKKHGVDKIFKLDPTQKSLPGREKRMYLVRANMVNMKYIADQVLTERQQDFRREYTVVMVPRRLHVCEMVLEKEGVFGHVKLEEFHLELFPLDTHLLSLQMPDIFKSFYLDGDYTFLQTVASSLNTIQSLFGNIPNVYTIGRGSKMVYDLMKTMQEQVENPDLKFHIGQLYIIDRDVDYVTPMCSPMSYEALLDETFGIDCGIMELSGEILNKPQSTKMLLTSQDPIYSEIRDRHFSSVFPFLSSKAKELQAIHEKKNSLKTVGDVKNFVSQELGRLKQQQAALSYHISACEHIMKSKTVQDFENFIHAEHDLLEGINMRDSISYIEDCIYRQSSLTSTLRLLCLLSLTQNGVSSKDFKSLKTDFLHSHGFEHLTTFFLMKKLGLFVEQETSSKVSVLPRRSQFRQLANKLNLIPKMPEEVNLKEPSDIAFVFGGACSPLSVKLVEYILLHSSLQTFDDLGRMIPGGIFSEIKYKGASKSGVTPATAQALKTVMVYFIGGCTFSEVAALRMIAQKEKIQIIIATTAMITGNSLLEQIIEKKQS